jgi:hypothetical protein
MSLRFCLGDRSLEFDLRPKAVEITVNGSDGQFSACTPVIYRAVARVEPSVDLGLIPSFGMADIGDAEIVLLGPKERDCVKSLSAAKDVPRGGLPLALGHDKMLDADPFAGEPVRPARDVPGCEDARDAGLELFVHCNPSIDGKPCSFSQ